MIDEDYIENAFDDAKIQVQQMLDNGIDWLDEDYADAVSKVNHLAALVDELHKQISGE